MKKTIFQGRFLNVNSADIRLPNGREINFEFIDHPGAVLIIPFLSETRVVMIKQYRPSIGDYLYELPAGTIELGEELLACAKREIIEEIGYEAKTWENFGYIYPCPGYSNERIYIFKATELTPNNSLKQDDEECIEVKVFDKKMIKEFFQKGLINDSKTIAAFVYCDWL